MRLRLVFPCLALLLSLSSCASISGIFGGGRESRRVLAQYLPGQIIPGPENPAFLVYNRDSDGNGELDPALLCGPGDPEGFLYLEAGRQDEILRSMEKYGGNCLYLMAVRSHGGDGGPEENPFTDPEDPASPPDKTVLAQWDRLFDRANRIGITVFFILYDDSADPFEGTETVSPREARFIEALVNRFERHPLLIWCVAEEYHEALSPGRAEEIARLIRQADDFDHVVAIHHRQGDRTFDFADSGAFQQFAQQCDSLTDEAVHADIVAAFGEAAGRWNINMAENQNPQSTEERPDHRDLVRLGDRAALRHRNWAIAMAGAHIMVLGTWAENGADPTPEMLRDMRTLQRFFERTDFNTMRPADYRAEEGTEWVLAGEEGNAILYARDVRLGLGLKAVLPGIYDLLWIDAETGTTFLQASVRVRGGSAFFRKPLEIGPETAVWIQRVGEDMPPALEIGRAGSEPAPSL